MSAPRLLDWLPPTPVADALLKRAEAELQRAEADVAHALRWGWAPGSSTVRQVFGLHEPWWAGLAYWLDRGLGSSKKYSTVSLNTKPPDWRVHEGHHRV